MILDTRATDVFLSIPSILLAIGIVTALVQAVAVLLVMLFVLLLLVLDPFGGSGSTLIACEKTGRRARLIELDPKYVDVIVQRWQDYTGNKALLDGEDRTFDDLKSVRLTKDAA